MKNWNVKSLLPHLAALAIFVTVALLYCKPALQGKVLQQSDIVHWKGMSKDIQNYRDIHGGRAPMWTTSMFSGMPGYQIASNNNNYVSYYANELFSLFIPKPFRFFILACLGFYFLCCVLSINSWLSILGALAFAYSSYDPVIISVGHDTKMLSIAYMPALLGGIFLIFQKRYWTGAAATVLFSSILVNQNHYQVTYYFLIVAACAVLVFAVEAFRRKTVGNFFLAASIALAAGLMGVLANAVMLFTTYDYAKETIRGGQASLSARDSVMGKGSQKGGLDTAYAFTYSYGLAETFTFIVPNIYGGASTGLGEDSKLVETLGEKGIPQQAINQIYGSLPAYWGNQPQTAGPVYLGAVICFLFIFGLVYLKSNHKWWIIAASAIAILMSWGKNFGVFNNFLFEHLPMYNKFRAPTIILIIPQLCFPLMACLTLQQAIYPSPHKDELWKKFKRAVWITAGVFVFLVLLYFSFDYRNGNEKLLQDQLTQATKGDPSLGKSIVGAAIADRRDLFGKDLMRSLFFVAASIMVLGLFIKEKMKAQYAVAALLLLSAMDLLNVDRRYLNDENFLEAEDSETVFAPTPADIEIKRDTDPNFRVLNLTQDVFNDAITSYHHKSIGGYHAAKLSSYQDLIENQIGPAIQRMAGGVSGPGGEPVLNMLNMKYTIFRDPNSGQFQTLRNPGALGSCWLVKAVSFVKDPKQEMRALDHFNPADTAFVQDAYKSAVPFAPQWDSSGSIRLVKNENDLVTYTYKAPTPQFAVFSEVYYSRGWKAYIDGKESPIARVNYVLRGLAVPAGSHNIEFRFAPVAYTTGSRITGIMQILMLLIFAVGIFMGWKKSGQSTRLA